MLKGGIADKLGNAYEALWTLTEALRVLRGQADEIRIEPFNEDARGLEFRVSTRGQSVWHQCKRRLGSGSWTLSALDTAGVLGDFARKLVDPANACVFVSSDPTPVLKALTGKAAIVEGAQAFLDSLSKDDQLGLQRLAAAWGGDPPQLFNWLRRLRIETVSDASLQRELTGLCELLFTIEPDVALERLAGFLDDTVTHVISAERLRAAVDDLGLGWRARLDPTLPERLDAATDAYLASLGQPIAGVQIDTPELLEAVALAVGEEGQLTVVSGGAGSGKSLALARIIAAARDRGWPVLAFRVDWFLDARSLADVGTGLLERAENPVASLGNRVGAGDALLVIDQVDAVSEASGRSGRIRELLFQMIAAARFYPGLRLVVACRSYDLDNDSRLKGLEKERTAAAVRLKPLDWATAVEPVMRRLGLQERSFSARQREILGVAINLQVFATLVQAGELVEGDVTGVQLFDRLLERRAREFVSAGVPWTPQAAMSRVAAWMSENQVLAAPAGVLSAFPGAVDLLSSHGLLTKAGAKVQFRHESFFDNMFSADFVGRGDSVLALLKSDRQRLFRRTQVRQIFARLRDQGGRAYLANLREVMDSPDVRFLVKDAIAGWLASVEGPSEAEHAIVQGWWGRGRDFDFLARAVVNGRGWLPRLIASGALEGWIAGEGERKPLGLWLLRKGAVEHSAAVAATLRAWRGGDPGRVAELVEWFEGLYPDGAIGALETLYADAVAALPDAALKPTWEANFSLGGWVHKDGALGARVLGLWLDRWMAAFPLEHPFASHTDQDAAYWLNELAEKIPCAFLEAVWPSFVEAVRRDRSAFAEGRIDYPTIRLPFDGEDDSILRLLEKALVRAAAEAPGQVAAWLDQLAPDGGPALWLHLRAIAANPAAFHQRLTALLAQPELLDIGEDGGAWRPFAEAAHAAYPRLAVTERASLEQRVLAHRPELARVREIAGWRRDDGVSLAGQDRAYAVHLLNRSGQIERAILATIGADRLGTAAHDRLVQLERKFRGEPLPEAYGIRGGFVRSPIDLEPASRMTDRQWLKAFKRYNGDEHRVYEVDGVVGGAEQLAHVLQARVKVEPARFVRLLERLPHAANPAYPAAILRGLRETEIEDGIAALAQQAFHLTAPWGRDRLAREVCWLIQRHPDAARERAVLDELLRIAAFGEASDTAIRSSSPRTRTQVRELLSGTGGDLESSGINGDRGAAWEALAAVLWDNPEALAPVTELLDRRIEGEPLTSVRMCMYRSVNAVMNYDIPRGLAFLNRLAAQDLPSLSSRGARHVLRWATYNHTAEVQPILDRLATAEDEGLRALGAALQSGLALTDPAREAAFQADLAGDDMKRRIGAYVAAGNLGSDAVGERATRWLAAFFEDPDADVRREAARADWGAVLDRGAEGVTLARTFLRSAAFADEPDSLMRALDSRLERVPDLAFEAVGRVLDLEAHWATQENRRHFWAEHRLGRILVALYRAIQGDEAAEDQLLDLFDRYLLQDLRDIRDEIGAYERH